MPARSQKITPRALLDLRSPAELAVSPDGRVVVFSLTEACFEESRWVSRLWTVPLAGGSPKRLTNSYEGEHSPKWSPDGTWIAFLSPRPDLTKPPPTSDEEQDREAQTDQLWLLPADGGEAERLSHHREAIRDYGWMPDSKSIVFLTQESRPAADQAHADELRRQKADPFVEREDRRKAEFWEIALEDKRPWLLHVSDPGVREFDLAPDGKRLVFTTNYSGEPDDWHRVDLFELDLESNSPPRKLVEREGCKSRPRWTFDGSAVAFTSPEHTDFTFSRECCFLVRTESGELTELTAGATFDVIDLVPEKRSAGVLAVVAERTCEPVFRLGDGDPQRLSPDRPLSASAVAACPDGRVVAVLESSAETPELHLIEPGGETKQLTELNRGFAERFKAPEETKIEWQSDEWKIEGLLSLPPSARPGERLPLVVDIHGGPKAAAVHTLRGYTMPAVWAAEGYAVLRPNYRGSEGYGSAFAMANRKDLGGGDFRDTMTGIDTLIELGIADPNRIGIIGGSYGGYLVNWAISQSNRFRAAISMFGMFNLVSSTGNSEFARWEIEYLGAPYWQEPELYRRMSPAAFADRIRTPTLILHGEADANTFISNSRELYHALRTQGVEAEFVHYPREGHGLAEPNHRLDEMRRCLEWFGRHLRPEPIRRLGDKVAWGDYELVLTRAERLEFVGRPPDEAPLMEVAIALTTRTVIAKEWELHARDLRLETADGTVCELAGVPVDAGGGRALLQGARMRVAAHPHPDTGRLSLAFAAAFRAPVEACEFVLRFGKFQPIAFSTPAEAPEEKKRDRRKRG